MYMFQRKIRQTLRGKILIGEFIFLLCFHIVFLCVLYTDNWTSGPEVKGKVCFAQLVVFHYTALASASLMSMHGISLYVAFVKNLNMDSRSYQCKAAVLALGKYPMMLSCLWYEVTSYTVVCVHCGAIP